jgi:hypothetical protein
VDARAWGDAAQVASLSDRARGGDIELLTVAIDKPDDLNVILGQSHFIKTVEDIHEVLAGASP